MLEDRIEKQHREVLQLLQRGRATTTEQDNVIEDILPEPLDSVEELDNLCTRLSEDGVLRKKLVINHHNIMIKYNVMNQNAQLSNVLVVSVHLVHRV